MDEIARLEGFRARLKKALEVRKMSQGAVEKAAGLPDSYLSKVLLAKRNELSFLKVSDIARALRVRHDWLTDGVAARAALRWTEIVRADIGPIDLWAYRP